MITDVLVYVSIDDQDVLAGHLYSHRRRGSESASFTYDPQYLARPDAYALDPQLPLLAGTQQTPVGLALFPAFADSSPDRWGRNLIQRRERLRAREEGRTDRSYGEFDLLLGVRDDLRQGALRFRADPDGTFLATETEGVPLLTDLPGLLGAADVSTPIQPTGRTSPPWSEPVAPWAEPGPKHTSSTRPGRWRSPSSPVPQRTNGT